MGKIFLVLMLLSLAAPSVVRADMPGFSSSGLQCTALTDVEKKEGKKDPCWPLECKSSVCQ